MHEQDLKNTTRLSAPERGYDAAWHVFAKKYLIEHKICAMCGRPARVVDHKTIPAKIMLDMYGHFLLDEEYYQPLCFSCNRKKMKWDKEFFEKYKKDLELIEKGVKEV